MNIQDTNLMTVTRARQMTAAEQSLVDSFDRQSATLPGDDKVSAIRRRELEKLRSNGLPSRRVEAWHYTDLRTLLKSVPAEKSATPLASSEPIVTGSCVVPVINGQAGHSEAPEGVSVTDFQRQLTAGNVVGMGARHEDDVVGSINSAFVSGGQVLSIDPEAALDDIIELQVVHGGGQAHTRFPVSVGRGSRAVVIERHMTGGESPALVSSITDLEIEPDADLTWVIVQEQGLSDTHLGQINVRLGANARLALFVANAGGQLVRQEVNVVADGEGSNLALSGINLLGGNTHADVTMTLDHLVPNCVSTETLRNVVFDRAHGVFQGQIRVAQIAQKTDARMACNTLLLSDTADFSTKPELEIFADDVQCAHGATVIDIDDNHLFYLMARGIDRKKARSMLVKAFIAELIEELENDALVDALETRFEAWLDNHG